MQGWSRLPPAGDAAPAQAAAAGLAKTPKPASAPNRIANATPAGSPRSDTRLSNMGARKPGWASRRTRRNSKGNEATAKSGVTGRGPAAGPVAVRGTREWSRCWRGAVAQRVPDGVEPQRRLGRRRVESVQLVGEELHHVVAVRVASAFRISAQQELERALRPASFGRLPHRPRPRRSTCVASLRTSATATALPAGVRRQ